jgi:hypothetical protein
VRLRGVEQGIALKTRGERITDDYYLGKIRWVMTEEVGARFLGLCC